MDSTLRSSFVPRSYQDFAPPSDWIREQGSDKLVIELPGFRKEQLKIQLDNFGSLRATGERPLEGSRWKRFRREFRIPDNCNANEIRAKFEDGVLTVTFPKLAMTTRSVPSSLTTPPAQAESSTTTPTMPPAKAEPTAPTLPTTRAPEAQTVPESRQHEHEPAEAAKGEVKEEKLVESKREEKAVYGVSGLPVGMKRKRKRKHLLINAAAVAVIVLVGVGIYVAYCKFRELAEAETAAELHYEL